MIPNKPYPQLSSTSGFSAVIYWRTGLIRAVLFALIWWILTDGVMNSWLIGIPAVFIAALVSIALLPPFGLSLRGIINFIPYFVWHSLRGGVDVAWCAMHPRLPISPTLVDYNFRLPPGPSRVFMSNTISLLPGTLSIELDNKCVRVHVLDKFSAFAEELVVLERQVAAVFGLELPKK